MKKQWMPKEPLKAQKAEPKEEKEQRPAEGSAGSAGMAGLHHAIGNQAVQRLIAQRNGPGPTELDDETAGRIDRARSGGQALDGAVQEEMGQAMGYDFAGVRAHTSPEADDLSRELGAKAFTTGQDVFFREGAYDPASTAGRELIAHELTHVVQQGTGQVQGGSRMTVNAPGDVHEQRADASAHAATSAGVQRQEEEELVQAQEDPEEEDLVQAQEVPEEEDLVQAQPEEEEEELVQPMSDEEEEEEWVEP
ncbi:MAG: DUF4157 domain-containing protein [Anaerolineae bacterium]|jgi:hypothetical protein